MALDAPSPLVSTPNNHASTTAMPKSRFKPATGFSSNVTLRKPQTPTLPAFSTPGFGKTKPTPTTTPCNVNTHHETSDVICLSSSSDLSSKSAIKRTSSDPSFTIESSPSSKRARRADNKENVFKMATHGKGKGKGKERVLPKANVVEIESDFEESMDQDPEILTNPWDRLDRDFPLPKAIISSPKPFRRSQASPTASPGVTKFPDLDKASPERLTQLFMWNSHLRNQYLEAIVNYKDGRTDEPDIVTLQVISDFTKERITAIMAIKDGLRGAKFEADIPESSSLTSSTRPSSQALSVPSVSNEAPFSVAQPNPAPKTCDDSFQRRRDGSSRAQPVEVDASYEEDDGLWASFEDPAPPAATEAGPSRSQPKSCDSPTPNRRTAAQAVVPYHPEVVISLNTTFRLKDFRHHQLEAINATLEGKDVFVLMPTGGGKSLCYQLPATCKTGRTQGVTFVVSPLLALINDQVQALRRKGIDVVAWTSDSGGQTSEIMRRLGSQNKPALVYVTPEKLQASGATKSILVSLYRAHNLARFVIDEAHCISTWGRDFREAYTGLNILREEYPDVPIMALTATANEGTVNDIISRLKLKKDCVKLVQSFNRKNLNYMVQPKLKNVVLAIAEFINTKHRNETGIIYCLSRNKCEEVAAELREKHGIKARHYHALMSPAEKLEVQQEWQDDVCRVIVATIAFGMGVDKPDVRFVVHHSLPKSMDGYYQETGRAGRDGKPADCLLFYAFRDAEMLFQMARKAPDNGEPISPEVIAHQEEGIRVVVGYCTNNAHCRRVQILQYFDEKFNERDCQRLCDNCSQDGLLTTQDVTTEAQGLLRIVQAVERENVTQSQVVDLFRGAKNPRNLSHELCGVGKDMKPALRHQLVPFLLAEGALGIKHFANGGGWNTAYVMLGPEAHKFLNGEKQLLIPVRTQAGAAPPKSKRGTARVTKKVNIQSTTTATVMEEPFFREDSPIEFDDDPVIASSSKKTNVWPPPRSTALRTKVLRHDESVEIIEDYEPEPEPEPEPSAGPSTRREDPNTSTEDPTYKELQACVSRINEKLDGSSSVEELDSSFLQVAALMLPDTPERLKEALRETVADAWPDPEDAERVVNERYRRYGKEVLEILRRRSAAAESARAARVTVLHPADLHDRFEYRTPSLSSSSSAAPQAGRRGRFKPAKG